MSNVMSLKDVRNKPSRNAFDKSQKNVFSAKAGELLPVFCEEVLPGDKFKIDLASFTRTMPLDTAAYTRLREYYDFYFVPFRQLWRFSDNFFTQMKVTQSAYSSEQNSAGYNYETHPYITTYQVSKALQKLYTYHNHVDEEGNEGCKNELGYFRYNLSRKLLEYLGYSNAIFATGDTSTDYNSIDELYGFYSDGSDSIVLNPFPLLAYQKIYADYFRDSQWEDLEPWTFNCDYINITSRLNLLGDIDTVLYPYGDSTRECRHTFLDLRYCNYDKGLLTGLLSSPQYGDTAVAAPLLGSQPLTYTESASNEFILYGDSDMLEVDGKTYDGLGLSVLALRQAEFLQKWREVSYAGRQDYKEQIKKHWNVDVSKSRSDMAFYLGGQSSAININEVVNTNLASSSSMADIAGKGVGSTNKTINFEASEHGIIMCIYHVVPLLDFSCSGITPLCTKANFTDYAIPEFDKLGMQAVPLQLLFAAGIYNSDGDDKLVEGTTELGYAPRYYDYKTSLDRVRGVFSQTLKNWVTPIDAQALYNAMQWRVENNEGDLLNYSAMKVNPSVLDNVFAVAADDTVDTDQFLVNSYFDCKVVRNLDYNGLPY